MSPAAALARQALPDAHVHALCASTKLRPRTIVGFPVYGNAIRVEHEASSNEYEVVFDETTVYSPAGCVALASVARPRREIARGGPRKRPSLRTRGRRRHVR